MFSLFASCSNFCKTVMPPPEPVLPYNEMFGNVEPLSRNDHSHEPYKKYTTRCTFGCVKPAHKR